MEKQPKSDRTPVTISKRVQRRLKIAVVILQIAQKEFVEASIEEYKDRVKEFWR